MFFEKIDDRNLFKVLRESRKISYREVARLSRELFKDKAYHMSPTYILRLERGDYDSPSIKKLKALATIYKVPIELFLNQTIEDKKMSTDAFYVIGSRIVIDTKKLSFEQKEIIMGWVRDESKK